MKRDEVWLVTLDPTVGSDIRKTRPCVLVSPDELNAHSRTFLVAPLTSGSRRAQYRVPVTFRQKSGLILPDQLRTVDRDRLVRRLGRVNAATGRAVREVLRSMFAE